MNLKIFDPEKVPFLLRDAAFSFSLPAKLKIDNGVLIVKHRLVKGIQNVHVKFSCHVVILIVSVCFQGSGMMPGIKSRFCPLGSVRISGDLRVNGICGIPFFVADIAKRCKRLRESCRNKEEKEKRSRDLAFDC
jgi:hypothetical protein